MKSIKKKRENQARNHTAAETRKRRRRQRIITAGISIPIILLTAFFLLCNILIDMTLVPEVMEQTAAFSEITEESIAAQVHTDDIQQNRIASWEQTNEWLKNVDSEEITVTTTDGYRLVGRLFPQEQESHKWVLLLHGYTGWKEELYPIAYEYAARGYQVLSPDMRCSGESEGDFIGMGWTDRLDNLLWLDEITKRDPNAEIVIHGQSMGAACGMMMTGVNLPDQVRAIISDSGYTDVYAMFEKQLKEWFHLPGFPILDGANLLLQLRGGYNIKEASALKAVEKSTIPLLLIHGDQDQFVPAEMTKKLYEAAAGEKEILIIKGAGHAQCQDKDPKRYYDTVFSFLSKYIV